MADFQELMKSIIVHRYDKIFKSIFETVAVGEIFRGFDASKTVIFDVQCCKNLINTALEDLDLCNFGSYALLRVI